MNDQPHLRVTRTLRMPPLAFCTALLVAAGLAMGWPALAAPQGQPGSPSGTASPNVLEDAPVVVEELGISIQPPRHSAHSKERGADGQPTVTIADGSPAPVWQMRIQALVPELQNPTPKLLIEDHIAKLKASGRDLTVLSSKEVKVGTAAGWQAFLADPSAEEPLVNGYLIVEGQGPPFIVVSIVCTLSDFSRMRPTIEASLASVKIDSPQRIADEREARLKAGAALVASFDTSTLKSLVGLDQWFRHYKPGASGGEDIEIGVSHITVREGKRGELNRDRSPAQYDKTELQDGLLLTVEGRVVLDRDRDMYYDTLAIYWMSWDDAVEAWSIVAARKQKSASISEAETGFRVAKSTGQPTGVLTVVKSGIEGANREPKEWTLPEYYLSQPIAWLLGHLMAVTNAPAGDYSFYAYDSSVGSLSLRQDSWVPRQGAGGAGTLTSRFNTQSPPVTAEFDRDGKLVKRTRPDGSVSVPITVAELRRLWSAKGLKLGSGS